MAQTLPHLLVWEEIVRTCLAVRGYFVARDAVTASDPVSSRGCRLANGDCNKSIVTRSTMCCRLAIRPSFGSADLVDSAGWFSLPRPEEAALFTDVVYLPIDT